MDSKKCNKCGKVKPLLEMTRRRDEETGGVQVFVLLQIL